MGSQLPKGSSWPWDAMGSYMNLYLQPLEKADINCKLIGESFRKRDWPPLSRTWAYVPQGDAISGVDHLQKQARDDFSAARGDWTSGTISIFCSFRKVAVLTLQFQPVLLSFVATQRPSVVSK